MFSYLLESAACVAGIRNDQASTSFRDRVCAITHMPAGSLERRSVCLSATMVATVRLVGDRTRAAMAEPEPRLSQDPTTQSVLNLLFFSAGVARAHAQQAAQSFEQLKMLAQRFRLPRAGQFSTTVIGAGLRVSATSLIRNRWPFESTSPHHPIATSPRPLFRIPAVRRAGTAAGSRRRGAGSARERAQTGGRRSGCRSWRGSSR